jgi:hypothetical protein
MPKATAGASQHTTSQWDEDDWADLLARGPLPTE